jgi:hypothetical protein
MQNLKSSIAVVYVTLIFGGCAPEEAKMGPYCEEFYGSGNCCNESFGKQTAYSKEPNTYCIDQKHIVMKSIIDGADPEGWESECKAGIDIAKKGGACTGESQSTTTSGGSTCSATDACDGCVECGDYCECLKNTQGYDYTACMNEC